MQRANGKVVNPRMVPTVMDIRLRHFARAKDPAGCRATAERWEALKRTDAGSLYGAACMRAVTAAVLRAQDNSETATKDAAAEDDQAMTWLQKAVTAGFRNTGLVNRDRDLDALRGRSDFRKLVMEMMAES